MDRRCRFPIAARSWVQGWRCASCACNRTAAPLRVFYAFDPVRQAVLLIGGDKTGDDRFYERMIPLAERIWIRYIEER